MIEAPFLRRLPNLVAAFASLVVLFAVIGTAFAADPGQAYVKSLSDRATAILQDKSLDKDGRFNAFKVLILENTEIDRIGDFALGRYAQAMRDSGNYDEYKRLFRDYVVRIYASRLSSGTGQSLRIVKSVPKGDTEEIVFCVLDPAKGDPSAPLDVNWRLVKDAANGFKIKDVQIAGAWMAIEQQSQFQSIVTNNNRNPASLIEFLQKKLNEPVSGGPKAKGT